jgi:hypothetical protein
MTSNAGRPVRGGELSRAGSRRRSWTGGRSLRIGVLLAVLSGCSDLLGPGASPDGVTPSETLFGSYVGASEITCNVTMATLTVACGSGNSPVGATNVGGKGNSAKLVVSGITYTPGTQVFAMNVAVQNLLVQQMGTSDGPTITGMRTFFTTNPFRTAGSGPVALLNPDGTDTFTAAGQKYFEYLQKVPLLGTTSTKNWQFTIGPSVTSWRFRVYVSTELLPVVVFDKEDAGNRDIYRVALDGTDLVRISSHAAADLDPTAGQGRITYASYRNGQADLYSTALQGGGTHKRLTNTAANELAPAVDPKNVRVAFTSDLSGASKLWWADVSATGDVSFYRTINLALVPIGNGWIEASPIFDPTTNNYVSFVVTNGTSADIHAMVVGLTGNNFANLVVNPAADVEPAYNAAGTRLAFTSTRNGDVEIYELNLGTNVVTRITNRAGYDAQPTYLPDGRIVFVRDVAGVRSLRWINPATLVEGTIPTGSGTPRNPFVVPLY